MSKQDIELVGRFSGDWSKDISTAKKKCIIDALTNKNQRKGKPNSEQPITAETYPMLQKMVDTFALKKTEYEPVANNIVHVQKPMTVFEIHQDYLENYHPADPEKIVRFFVMLEDWEIGHFLHFGNTALTGYKAGEIYKFNWPGVSHCTANASKTPRINLNITGIATDRTYELLGQKNFTVDLGL